MVETGEDLRGAGGVHLASLVFFWVSLFCWVV